MRNPVADLRVIVMALLSLLAVEFALGIYANLYVSFSGSSGGPSMMDGSQIGGMHTVMDHAGLALHMMLGFLLAAMGIAAVVLAVRAGQRSAIWLAVMGLAALATAGIAGMIFVTGGQASTASYVMAIAFLVSFSCYFAELTVTRP